MEYSQIHYDKLIISDPCREHKTDLYDFKQDEPYVIESENELLERVVKFRDYVKSIKPDLIMSHADLYGISHHITLTENVLGNG